jgi:hypothetical protein
LLPGRDFAQLVHATTPGVHIPQHNIYFTNVGLKAISRENATGAS